MKPSVPPPGTRIRCLAMNDPQAVPRGILGTVTGSTDMGSWMRIAVHWDNGSRLALAVPPDQFVIPVSGHSGSAQKNIDRLEGGGSADDPVQHPAVHQSGEH